MILQATITTPANTSIAAPKVTVMEGMRGVVYRGQIDFPPGSSGLLGVVIFDGAFRLYPFTPGEWFRGNSVTIDWEDAYRKDTEPFIFPIHTYNLDDTYEHECSVRLWVATTEEEISAFVPLVAAQKIEDAVNKALGTAATTKSENLVQALKRLRRKKG